MLEFAKHALACRCEVFIQVDVHVFIQVDVHVFILHTTCHVHQMGQCVNIDPSKN